MEAPEAVPAQEMAMEVEDKVAEETAEDHAAAMEPAAAAEDAAVAAEGASTASPPTSKKKPAEPAKTPKTVAAKAKAKATPASDVGTGTGGLMKRERKQVEFFQPEEVVKKDVEEVLAVGAGSGSKLRDIPNIAFKLSKCWHLLKNWGVFVLATTLAQITGKDELIEGLHNVLFRRKGAANQRKKAVLDFSGFAFADDQEKKELEARRTSLSKWKLELVHRAMDVLDLQRGSGEKAAKVERILEFLQEPHALSDVDLAAKEASKKEKEKAKRERAAAKKERKKARKEMAKKEEVAKRKSGSSAGRPAKKAKKVEDKEDEEPEEESEAGEEEEAEEEEEEEKVPAKKDRCSGGGWRKAAALEVEKAEPMEEDAQPADTELPQQPQEEVHPASKVPSDELKAAVEEILEAVPGTDLPQITTKPILKKLEAKFGFSLKSRKEEVIAMAQAFVQAYLEVHPDPAEEEEKEAVVAEGEPEPVEEAAAAPEPEATAEETAPEPKPGSKEPAAEEAPEEQA